MMKNLSKSRARLLFPISFSTLLGACFCFLVSINIFADVAAQTTVTTSHGFALYKDLKYSKNFPHFSYVNPQAPQGGTIRLMGFGNFDTLNPYTLKGTSPFNSPGQFMYGFSELNETLLAGTGSYSPSGDEPQSAYGLIAESLRYPENISWVVFRIRPEAKFHDEHKIDASDVVFSFNTLIKKGHPRFQQSLLNVETVEALNETEVRFTFKQKHQRASILRVGEMPILPEHFWQQHDFESSSELIPLLSGPYQVTHVDLGKRVGLSKFPDFWAKDLNIYRGRFNFETVTIDYYRDQTVAFEAFKAGAFDLYYDYTAKNWASAYDFPALKAGKVSKVEIPHEIPSGTQGFFFNTRRELFSDVRVREALGLMFDFEWTNKNLFNGAYTRNQSYYPNSSFSASGLPTQEERRLLEPFSDKLPSRLFEEPYASPKTKGNGQIRAQNRRAIDLLEQAGWTMQNGTMTHVESGKTLKFEILLRQAGLKRVLLPYIKNLEKIGVEASIRLLDASQYKTRIDQFDYDMMTFVLSQGQAPSFEQRDYFHSSTRDLIGSQNYAGIANPAVDALLDQVIKATSRPELITAMRALDRVLLWNHYIVPNWHLDYHRLAYWNRFGKPPRQPPFILGVDAWWSSEDTTP